MTPCSRSRGGPRFKMQNTETVYSVQQDPRPRPSLLHARTIQAPANQNFQKCHMWSVKSLTEEPCLALGSLLQIDFNMEVVSLI